jgi:histone H4
MKILNKESKKIKKVLSYDIFENSKNFDVLYLIDATGSMASYITAAKEETKNIANQLKNIYPDMKFKYGYVFYRDPIDSKGDIHEIIDLTDDINSLSEKIGKIGAYGGGDAPEDWVGAYKLANEKINWRNGNKVIIHLTDAGAHGKLFTPSDYYPEEEKKLIDEIEKCAKKKINIFGYIIQEAARNTFEELAKIFRQKGGCFEIFDFNLSDSKNTNPLFSSSIIKPKSEVPERKTKSTKENPPKENTFPEDPQNMINRNFNNNSLMAINNVINAIKSKKAKSTNAHNYKSKRKNRTITKLKVGISNQAIRRLARRGGVKRISELIYEETRSILKLFLEKVLKDTIVYTEHSKRKTVTSLDVIYALKRQGRCLYGYGI